MYCFSMKQLEALRLVRRREGENPAACVAVGIPYREMMTGGI